MKKFLSILLACVMVFGVVATLAACADPGNGVEATVIYGEVGVENHSYFPYAVVKVDGKGAILELEMGEAFGPSGKLVVETHTGAVTNAYRNPWYPGFSTIVGQKLTRDQIEALPTADRHFISIGGKVFVLTVTSGNQDLGSVRAVNIYVFREYKAGETADDIAKAVVLHDRYLAAHMDWYLTAIKEGKVFACDSTGAKRTAAATINTQNIDFSTKNPADGALLKNQEGSTYQPGRGLSGTFFKTAMDAIADFIVENDGVIEFEYSSNGGNWESLRIKGFTFVVPTDEVVTQASSKNTATYFRYSASYAKVALRAIEIARGHNWSNAG